MGNDFPQFDEDGNMIFRHDSNNEADQAFINGDFDEIEMVKREDAKPKRKRIFDPATLERRALLWGDKE